MNIFVLRKGKIIFLLMLAVVVGGVCFAPNARHVFMSGTRNLPIYSVEREDSKVALTFNCAWEDKDIDQILETLSKYDIKATFFLVGQWAEKYPESACAIKDAGHELGGHSYDHKDYANMSEEQIKEDITKTIEVIENTTGTKINLIRVPSGSYNNQVISAVEDMGCVPIQWSIDTIDYGGADCESIFNRATEKTQSGDIVLMHTGTDNTAATLPRILDSLSSKYQLCTVSQLLLDDNYYVDNAGKMRQNNG